VKRWITLWAISATVAGCSGPRSDATQIADAISDEAISLRWSDRKEGVVRLKPITTQAYVVAVVPIASTISELRAAGIDESNAKQIITFMDEHNTNCIAVLGEHHWEWITLHDGTITIARPVVVHKNPGEPTEFILKEGEKLEVKLVAMR
jgi:hypothetical protein